MATKGATSRSLPLLPDMCLCCGCPWCRAGFGGIGSFVADAGQKEKERPQSEPQIEPDPFEGLDGIYDS